MNTFSLHVFMCVVTGEPGFYETVLSLCGVLSQYLMSLSKLPSSLHIPKDKETLITTFSTLAIEVRLIFIWNILVVDQYGLFNG